MGSKGRKPSGGFPRTFPRGLLSMLRTATERDRVCQGCSTTLLPPPGSCGPGGHQAPVSPQIACLGGGTSGVCHQLGHGAAKNLQQPGVADKHEGFMRQIAQENPLHLGEVQRACIPDYEPQRCSGTGPSAQSMPLPATCAGASWGSASSPRTGAHTHGKHTWPTSRNFQAQRWDTAHISPARSRLWADRKVPAWVVDREASLSPVCAHSKPVWSGLCPRACRRGCARPLPSHCRFSSH